MFIAAGEEGAVVLITLTIVGIITLIAIVYYYAIKRRKELKRIADKLGLSFYRKDKFRLRKRLQKHFSLFKTGIFRIAYNILLDRRENFLIYLFDYQYTVPMGRTFVTFYFGCLLVEFQREVFFPFLAIRRENIADKLFSKVGFDDIDFEWHEFSESFCVKSESKKFAYEVIDSRMMEFLMSEKCRLKIPTIQLKDRYILFYRWGNRYRPEELPRMYRFVLDFVGHIPALVRRKYRIGMD